MSFNKRKNSFCDSSRLHHFSVNVEFLYFDQLWRGGVVVNCLHGLQIIPLSFFKVDKSLLLNKKNKKPEPKVTSSEDEDEDEEDDEMIWKMNDAYEPIDANGGDSPYSTVPFLPKGFFFFEF